MTSDPRSLDDYRNGLRWSLSNKRYFAYAGVFLLKMSEFLDPADYAAILADVQVNEIQIAMCKCAHLINVERKLKS